MKITPGNSLTALGFDALEPAKDLQNMHLLQDAAAGRDTLADVVALGGRADFSDLTGELMAPDRAGNIGPQLAVAGVVRAAETGSLVPDDTGEVQMKSRRRFQVDLKERKVNQFKTFLEPEEKVRPLNPLADYIPIEKIANGVIYTRDGRYVKVAEVVPVNFLLRSAREQRSIIYSFISYLKIAPVKIQFKVLTKRADINRHMDTVRKELAQETDERCRQLQEDYLHLIQRLGSREAITRRFFLVFEYEPLPGTKRGEEETEAIASLQTAARTAANYLRQCGNEIISHENEDEAT